MQLLTKELLSKIPPLYSQEENPDPMVVAKFFTPDANWTWYVIDGAWQKNEEGADDFLFYGYVEGAEAEFGEFRLSELLNVRGKFGLHVERDRYFIPKPLSQIER